MRILFFLLLLPICLFAQKQKPKNYSRFDEKLFNFGFMLGFNQSDFIVEQKLNAYQDYSLISLQHSPTAGAQVGIVTTMKVITPMVRLRIIPTLSFQERVLNYTFENPLNSEEPILLEERVGSTNVDIPLMLQFRTKRLNNFAAYCLIGAQYSLDLQSQQDAAQDLLNPFIKIKNTDYQGQVGAGLEFFAPYFKFGLELKYSRGFNNSFIQDNTEPSNPINRLYNEVLWISFIFEG
jgi:hypothetical protein